ncbi:MAG: VOC family protein [Parvibaculum sp.]|uniref:VOC family protein n=1 Tax=Parvibaculum sp. TaxID=2024848 RepID=UPI0025D0C31E|nr:VOC family protein [Parvibaculum sp.]MCE9648647.1 VOC family protein [Parvibaculum sp.]
MNLLVNIDVDDLARAVDFYRRAFGLRIGRKLGGNIIEMLGGTTPVYLIEKSAGASATSPVRDYRRHWTPVHLDIVVDDIAAAKARAVEAGAVLESDVAENNWGKIALFADPFGHGFCLIEFIGRGYDEIAGD